MSNLLKKVIGVDVGSKFLTLSFLDDEKVETAIQDALAIDGAVLVNIFTDPNALAMPPKVGWEQIKGMGVAMTKMMLDGNFKEVADTITSNYKHIKEVL